MGTKGVDVIRLEPVPPGGDTKEERDITGKRTSLGSKGFEPDVGYPSLGIWQWKNESLELVWKPVWLTEWPSREHTHTCFLLGTRETDWNCQLPMTDSTVQTSVAPAPLPTEAAIARRTHTGGHGGILDLTLLLNGQVQPILALTEVADRERC